MKERLTFMNRKTFLKAFLIMMLFLSVCIMQNSSTNVNAAAKTTLNKKSMTIPVGKINYKTYWNTDVVWGFDQGWKLLVKSPVKGATYKFTSSNTKVVTIAEDGGYPTGVKAGKAVITCTQTLDGKTTEVAQCKITVKKANFETDAEMDYTLPVGSGAYTLYNHYAYDFPLFLITYRNPKATYSYKSDSANFSIKEVKWNASNASKIVNEDWQVEMLQDHIGDKYFYGYEYTAKKAGTYKITVKETYNKKTTTIGTFTIKVTK